MRLPDSLVEKLLLKSGRLNKKQLTALRKQELTEKKPLQDLVVINSLLSEKELTKLYAAEIDLPFVELKAKEIKKDTLTKLPKRVAKKYKAIVFDIDENGTRLVAMADPEDVTALNFLKKQLGSNVRLHITTDSSIESALDSYGTNADHILNEVAPDEDIIDPNDLADNSRIAQTLSIIIEYGIKAGASDIHIEPRENFVLVRYRIDGLLREANKLPRSAVGALVSRIKVLSELKLDEHRVPQDGRFKIQVSHNVFALRVSILPIVDGEKVVISIIEESSKAADLRELGFWGEARSTLQHAITQPHGMILITGPTGSGKSTTLFSILSLLSTPNVNIATIEDPVEHRIRGANQTQVNPVTGVTFSNGLRALLQQDPNIIMIGTIRDHETAELAVEASLTGHLLFSTLPTDSAAASLTRLIDMGVEPFLVASTIRVAVGQQLVRQLCPDCRISFEPDKALRQQLDKLFNLSSFGDIKRLHELEQVAMKDSVGTSKPGSTVELSTSTSKILKLYKSQADGCERCNHTGYRGRIGIYEVLDNSEDVQKLIVSHSGSGRIQTAAIKDGMLTMQMDGLLKALRGQTTFEEVLRVTSPA